MPTLADLIHVLETWAPPAYQESYDNAGLLVGNPTDVVNGVLVTLDCTEDVVAEAVERGCNVVVAHHPIVFKGLKKLNGKTYVERVVIEAIRRNVAIYAAHTNLDHVAGGVSFHLAAQLGLQQVRVLQPKTGVLTQLSFFVPVANTPAVLDALYAVGAGQIGAYDRCSFRVEGTGTFRPNDGANPAIGQVGQSEDVAEHRVELIFPTHLTGRVVAALHQAHPYEVPAYQLYPLANAHSEVGAGAVGTLPEPMDEPDFLRYVKETLRLHVVRHTPKTGKPVQRVAVCGGAGIFLLADAKRAGADAYVTADVKYHEFFDAEGQRLLCDVGHYESEVGTKELIRAHLSQHFTTFAVILSNTDTNPVRYFS